MTEPHAPARPIYQPPFISGFPFHGARVRSSFGGHWHGELEFIYVPRQGGSLAVVIEGEVHVLSPGSAAFVAGTQVHSGEVLSEDTVFLVAEMGFSLLGQEFSAFSGKYFLRPVLDYAGLPSGDPLAGTERTFCDIYGLVSTLPEDVGEWSPADRLYMESLLYGLAADLCRHMPMAELPSAKARRTEAVLAMQSVLTYVEKHYPDQLTVQLAAERAGYEKTRFCQLFKAATGLSFHKYLTLRRVRAARQLLISTSIPIGEVGRTVGIHEPKTFSRVIREIEGLTPGELRASAKREKE